LGANARVIVKLSDNWVSQSSDIGTGTTIRVYIRSIGPAGDTYSSIDLSIDQFGNFTLPFGSGWSTGVNSVFKIFGLQAPAYPLPGDLGKISNRINLGSSPPGNPLNPPGGASELNGLMNRTESQLVVYAYEITAPEPGFTNPPGYVPDINVVTDGDFQKVQYADPSAGDLQEVSIFSRKVNISFSSYGVTAQSALTTTLSELYVPNEALDVSYGEVFGAVYNIIITLDSSSYVSGIPVFDTNPSVVIPPVTPQFPPRKPPGPAPRPMRNGGGSRPNIRPLPGNGGTPADTQFIALNVIPDPIAFDPTDVATQRSRSYVIENIGTEPVTVSQIINTHPDNIFSFGINSPLSVPFTIDPDETLSGTAYFLPANPFSYNELAYIKSGADIVRTFGVTGVGTASGNPGDVILRSISLRGDVATSGDRNFLEETIGIAKTLNIFAVNTGSTPIILNSVSLGGSGVFTSTGITAGFNLQPGQETPIPVTFTPVGAQQYIGTFTLNSNAETSPQSGFNPATGDILANLSGEGVPETVLTRIMSFNVQNNGTFQDVLAGGSATDEITATITSIGNSSILIGQFQVQQPFSLELDAIGSFTIGSFEFYSLDLPLILPAGATSPIIKIKFTPPTATNYVDDVVVVSNKTLGPESFEVRGFGTFEEPEPEEPDEPILPDDEPPPGQEFDPGTVPSSALDGNGAACIPKECEVVYVYEYSSNGEIVT